MQSSPAGADTINGGGGVDTLLAGDSGAVNGGPGADQIVGGRTATVTTVHGNEDNDTIVSGIGDDDLSGDGGSNFLAYASVAQGALTVVNRGTNGVTARLPNTGQTAPGGRTGGTENDTIHDSFSTLVGSNGNDALTGSDRGEIILGVAPSGTPGVVAGPPGNDTLTGGAGTDVLLGNTGNDLIRSRDGVAESPVCGGGNDLVAADAFDTLGSDCEVVDRGASTGTPGGGQTPGGQTPGGTTPSRDTTKPRLAERPAVFGLRRGRRVVLRLACPNEANGCRGTFALRTRRRFRLGRGRAQRVTLARVKFRTRNRRSTRLSIKLSRRVVRLVRRGRSLRLIGAATIKDSSGNRVKTSVRLRLKRR